MIAQASLPAVGTRVGTGAATVERTKKVKELHPRKTPSKMRM